ncbi:MAG: MBL fold metallo-hydrolase [Planctomycetaceae bacterium]|nr:MBL fold metallo-hydrolase [Planctomycetaceae bacterium]
MLLKYFYDQTLAHASYLVGCQRSGTAVVVDPGRVVEPYLQVAAENGLKVVGVAETHIHADYVSGARELAARVGAKLYVSDEGPAEWKYQYLSPYDHQLLHDGDEFTVGNLKFTVMHTPGHTPESISFLLTDVGGGATEPMGIFTGDFVFVGSIGRPDLLEEAAGIFGSAKVGAHDLFASVKKFRDLPDYLQVWPAHGAGSACGKGLGAIPSSTVGYEKRFNPALQFSDESEFVDYILADQPEAPKYFAVMKRVNKVGPELLGTDTSVGRLDAGQFSDRDSSATLLDLSDKNSFRGAHARGSLNIPTSGLAAWAGWILDYNRPAYLIANDTGQETMTAIQTLHKIGFDRVLGVFIRSDLERVGHLKSSYVQMSAEELQPQIQAGQVLLLDVRSHEEWKAGHIPQAKHAFLGKLSQSLQTLTDQRPIVVQCQAGTRSAIAASIVLASGREVIDLAGGYVAWQQAGFVPDLAPNGSCRLR